MTAIKDLPWRETHNPYIIWVSEIILQQTQVVQGLDYFYRFITQFPSVSALANANIDTVLKYWQGLGYYSRAHYAQCSQRDNGKTSRQFSHRIYCRPRSERHRRLHSRRNLLFCLQSALCYCRWQCLPFLARYFGISTPIDSTNGKKSLRHLRNNC